MFIYTIFIKCLLKETYSDKLFCYVIFYDSPMACTPYIIDSVQLCASVTKNYKVRYNRKSMSLRHVAHTHVLILYQ